MPPASDSSSAYQQFVQSLIRPTPDGDAPASPTLPHVTINGAVRCKIYINLPAETPFAQAIKGKAEPKP